MLPLYVNSLTDSKISWAILLEWLAPYTPIKVFNCSSRDYPYFNNNSHVNIITYRCTSV